MAATTFSQENPYVTIHDEEIDICYGNKNYSLTLDKISKIYLSPEKPSYWSSIPGINYFIHKGYKLCIRTREEQEININVKAVEKHFFIDPIAIVRRLKKKKAAAIAGN